jgi:Holliday junction resolvase-like predicted endonuclease
MASPKRNKALRLARLYLEMRGYKVTEQDYHVPGIIVDLIASKDNIIYFMEVKLLNSDLEYESIASKPVPPKYQDIFVAAWQKETGINLPVKFGSVELLLPTFSVFNFSYSDS